MRRVGGRELRFGLMVAMAAGATALAAPVPVDATVSEARAALVAQHPDGARVKRWSPSPGLDRGAQMQALLAALGDPSTRVLDAAQWKSFLAEVSGQATVGVGLRELLDVDLLPDGNLAVVTTQPDGAAARAGLGPGDILERIDGVELRGRGLSEGMGRLRGEVGTSVRVDLRRGSQQLGVDLTREALPPAGDHVRAALLPGRSVLHLAIDGFSAETVAAVRNALAGHSGAPVVLDLRNNPGGELDAALAVAGLFVGERDVARWRTKAGVEKLKSSGARQSRARVVLVNEGTASAAELLTVALRDAGHAAVVGRTTRGKALVHVPKPLRDGRWLLISTGRILALDGSELLDRGITPTVPAEWSDSVRVPLPVPGAPERDPQLAAALAALD